MKNLGHFQSFPRIPDVQNMVDKMEALIMPLRVSPGLQANRLGVDMRLHIACKKSADHFGQHGSPDNVSARFICPESLQANYLT